jgi:hypothetical protein
VAEHFWGVRQRALLETPLMQATNATHLGQKKPTTCFAPDDVANHATNGLQQLQQYAPLCETGAADDAVEAVRPRDVGIDIRMAKDGADCRSLNL